MEDLGWHSQDVGGVFRVLDSSPDGLSGGEAAGRLKKYGPNELVEAKGRSAFSIFLEQFKSFLVIILIFAAVVSACVGYMDGNREDIYEAAAILVVILFITVVGFFQEYRAEEEIAALRRMVSVDATVLRDGKYVRIPAGGLVPGDVISLEAGDRIPADCRLFEVIDLKVDESALTGESVPAKKALMHCLWIPALPTA